MVDNWCNKQLLAHRARQQQTAESASANLAEQHPAPNCGMLLREGINSVHQMRSSINGRAVLGATKYWFSGRQPHCIGLHQATVSATIIVMHQ